MTEREQIQAGRNLMMAMLKHLHSSRARVEHAEKLILEDVAYLQQRSFLRKLIAYPDLWWACRRYRKMVTRHNSRVQAVSQLIREINRLRANLAQDAQFNQTF